MWWTMLKEFIFVKNMVEEFAKNNVDDSIVEVVDFKANWVNWLSTERRFTLPFSIVRNDITKIKADIIVNSANPKPVIGGGTDSAIYEAAGINKLLEKRKEIGEILPGEVAYTDAFSLNAKS